MAAWGLQASPSPEGHNRSFADPGELVIVEIPPP